MPSDEALMTCYCLSKRPFSECCQPLLKGQAVAQTAEQLMRSRYCAHVTGNSCYLFDTWAPEKRAQLSIEEIQQWTDDHDWLGLQVMQSRQGQAHHSSGTVEFIAYYREHGKTEQRLSLHELSSFRQQDKRWYYIDGITPSQKPKKTGRNDPCPCGSGLKFKKCCDA